MDPRISFSNDFADTQHSIQYDSSYKEAPVSSDFEFSVKKYTMIPADEIFFKGKLVPSEDNCTNQMRKVTLRDELLVDDEFEDVLLREPKNSGRWKERLGLKRGHNMPKKGDRNHGVLKRVVEEKVPVFIHEEGLTNKKIKEVLDAD